MPIDERELSANLGLDRRTVKELRDEILVEGEDFVRGRHRKVLITLPGQEKIKRHFFPERYRPETLASEELTGTVTHWQFRNKKIVEVDNEIIVRVRDSSLYRPNIWGNRCPITYKQMGGNYIAIAIPPPQWRKSQPRVK